MGPGGWWGALHGAGGVMGCIAWGRGGDGAPLRALYVSPPPPPPQEHAYIYLLDGDARLSCADPPHELPTEGKLR